MESWWRPAPSCSSNEFQPAHPRDPLTATAGRHLEQRWPASQTGHSYVIRTDGSYANVAI